MAAGVSSVLERGEQVADRCWVEAPGAGSSSYFEFIHSPFVVNGELKGVMSIGRDLTVLQRNQEELQRQKEALRRVVYIDGLTGLPTRHALAERIRELADAGAGFSMVSILLRNISQLIGSFGISTTEQLIVEAAATIQRAAPVNAQLLRRAEVSFDLILPDIVDAERLAAVSEQVIQQFGRPLHAGDVSISSESRWGSPHFHGMGPMPSNWYRMRSPPCKRQSRSKARPGGSLIRPCWTRSATCNGWIMAYGWPPSRGSSICTTSPKSI